MQMPSPPACGAGDVTKSLSAASFLRIVADRRIISRFAGLSSMQADNASSSLAAFTYRVLIFVGIVALAILAWRLADVLIIVFGGIILAATLRALTNFTVRHTPLQGRWALAVVVLALVALFALAGWLVGAQVSSQLQELFKLLPDAYERTRAWLQRLPIGNELLNFAKSAKEEGSGSLSGVAKVASGTFSALTDAVVMIFLGLYLAGDPDLYRRGVLHLVPVGGRKRALLALDAAGEALRKWLMGQLGAMVAVGCLTFAGLSLLGVPLAFALALIATLLEFIPFIGPILSGVPAVLVAFTVGPNEALYVVLLYLAIHQIEGNVIMPIVQKWAVKLAPALGIVSIVMFGLLFGLPGILFAVPLMVVVIALVKTLYVDGALEHEPAKRRAAS